MYDRFEKIESIGQDIGARLGIIFGKGYKLAVAGLIIAIFGTCVFIYSLFHGAKKGYNHTKKRD